MTRSWQGFWWRPDKLDDLHPGILTQKADGSTELALIGGFDLSIKIALPGGGYTLAD